MSDHAQRTLPPPTSPALTVGLGLLAGLLAARAAAWAWVLAPPRWDLSPRAPAPWDAGGALDAWLPQALGGAMLTLSAAGGVSLAAHLAQRAAGGGGAMPPGNRDEGPPPGAHALEPWLLRGLMTLALVLMTLHAPSAWLAAEGLLTHAGQPGEVLAWVWSQLIAAAGLLSLAGVADVLWRRHWRQAAAQADQLERQARRRRHEAGQALLRANALARGSQR